MNQKDKKIKIMGEEKISKALLKLGLPTMVGMLVGALYTVVDTYFVSGLGTSQVGAISIVFPIAQIVIGVGYDVWDRRSLVYIAAFRGGECKASQPHGVNGDPVQPCRWSNRNWLGAVFS